MTFEEAKKRIKECRKLSTDDYNKSEDEFIRGEAFAYKNALAILDEIDTEPSGSSGQLTLKELAQELRKLFDYRFLTCDGHGDDRDYIVWLEEPEYTRDGWVRSSQFGVLFYFEALWMAVHVDLSEYADADGNIDYSKCIVEVE